MKQQKAACKYLQAAERGEKGDMLLAGNEVR